MANNGKGTGTQGQDGNGGHFFHIVFTDFGAKSQSWKLHQISQIFYKWTHMGQGILSIIHKVIHTYMYSISLWMMDSQNPWESLEFCRHVVVWVVDYMWLMPREKSGSSWCPAASDQSLVAFGSVSLPSNLRQHAVRAVMSSIHHTSDRCSTNQISARPSVSTVSIK